MDKRQDQTFPKRAEHLDEKSAAEEKAACAPESSILNKVGVDNTEFKDKPASSEPLSNVQCNDAPGKGDSSLVDKGAGGTRNQGNSTSPSSKSE